MAEKKKAVGGEAGVTGRGAARKLTKEEIEAAEAAFPLGIDLDSPKGRWAAEQLAKGAKVIDINVALSRGAHPAGVPRD